MAWSKELNDLRDVLARLYTTESSARTFVKTALLNEANIAFSTRAKDNWTAILEEADRQGQVDQLIEVAMQEFPRNPDLQATAGAYRNRATVPAGTGGPAGAGPGRKPVPDRVTLRDFMVNRFEQADLMLLCADLEEQLKDRPPRNTHISLEVVGGGSKPIQVLNLIRFMDNRGWYDDLVAAVCAMRPEASFCQQ
jgi:hypothetical protein